ncbi:MAG: LPS assembly lipoprotein LptE [Woeseiaceae bacterium]
MLYRSAVLLAALSLSACGFQLRGAATLPPEMAKTYIEATNRHSLFYRGIRDGLRNAGVSLVESANDATAIFAVRGDQTGQRVLSVSARNVPREFEVYYTVNYNVETTNRVILADKQQTLTRDYTWDETLVLGKEKEEQLLREAIVNDLVRVILIQLSAT